MRRSIEALRATCVLAATLLSCAAGTVPGEGPRVRTTPPLSFTACAAKAESDAQEANACLTATPADPPIQRERARAILSGVCPFSERDGRIGCAACSPDFAAPAPAAAFAEVLGLREGSFSESGRAEALVALGPCAADQSEKTTLLLREEDGRFRRVALPPSLRDASCRVLPSLRGYSLLACETISLGAHGGTESRLDVIDLNQGRNLLALAVEDTRHVACGDARRTQLDHFGVIDVALRDLDRDGSEELWIRALWASGAEPERYDAYCRDLLSPPDDWLAVEPELSFLRCELPDEHCSILEFISKDASFRPSAEAGRILATLGARLIP